MVAEDEVVVVLTQTFSKKTEAIDEPSEEGGASILNKVGKQYHLPTTIVGRSSIAKRSAENEEVSHLPQADNSQTMPATLNTMTRVDYS